MKYEFRTNSKFKLIKTWNNIYTNNSLNDVMSLKRTKNSYVLNELKNMFNKDEDRFAKLLNQQPTTLENITNNIVISLHDKSKARLLLEEEGL